MLDFLLIMLGVVLMIGGVLWLRINYANRDLYSADIAARGMGVGDVRDPRSPYENRIALSEMREASRKNDRNRLFAWITTILGTCLIAAEVLVSLTQ